MNQEYLKILSKQFSKNNKDDLVKESEQFEGKLLLNSAVDGNSEAWNAILEIRRKWQQNKLKEHNYVIHPECSYLRGLASDSIFSNSERYLKTFKNIIEKHPDVCPIKHHDLEKHFTDYTHVFARALPVFLYKNAFSDALDVSRSYNSYGVRTISDYIFNSGVYFLNDYLGKREEHEYFEWPRNILRQERLSIFEPFQLLSELPEKLDETGYDVLTGTFGTQKLSKPHPEALTCLDLLKEEEALHLYTSDIDIVFNKREDESNNQDLSRAIWTAYRYNSQFFKWHVLETILRAASRPSFVIDLPEFDLALHYQADGETEYTSTGLHLIGCAMAFYKTAQEIVSSNLERTKNYRAELPRHFCGLMDDFFKRIDVSKVYCSELLDSNKNKESKNIRKYYENYRSNPYKPYYNELG